MSTTTSLRDIAGDLVLVGAGKMGAALLDGWAARSLELSRVAVLEPQPSLQVSRYLPQGLRLNPERKALRAAAIVIAVKPQSANEVLPSLAPMIAPATVVISIMAGRTLAALESGLPPRTAIVRTMPNTPAAVGRGITVAVPNAHVTPAQRLLAERLIAATGVVEWIDDERLMDAVTAVSGSGPAYVFLLAEYLALAGAAAGLPPALAEKLARVTVAGSGELLHLSPEDAATLRKDVTSPGGTTAAALDVLMAKDGLEPLLNAAVAAATRRSRELGS
ncbi:MAG: pyrroline-5-carboxylate reductase [Xanthobacteraceae bacterium]